VGEEGEVDFKEDAKFAQHMKEKVEAVSEFAMSKSLAQQRQYLPIFSIRDDLLQVCPLHLSSFSFIYHLCLNLT
jgi:pre-mRNA-splicing factor ATP-dependent RNA helicase DHX38/PRP16